MRYRDRRIVRVALAAAQSGEEISFTAETRSSGEGKGPLEYWMRASGVRARR